jgi:ubiquinone/menaquinone biosynthesis C-methylase UbiE
MNVQDRINQYWTRRAPAFDDYQQRPERLAADHRTWTAIWTTALPPVPLDVLDVGTGCGQVAMILAELGHRVTGIDLSEGMLAQARRHAGTIANGPDFRLGDAVHPDLPAGTFDAVTNRYLMWTLREPKTAVTNWIRLLRPSGTIAVVDSAWFPEGLENAPEDLACSYDAEVRAALPLAGAKSIDQTAEVLDAAGFKDITITPLTAIYDLDLEYGVAPCHQIRMQFMITGRS